MFTCAVTLHSKDAHPQLPSPFTDMENTPREVPDNAYHSENLHTNYILIHTLLYHIITSNKVTHTQGSEMKYILELSLHMLMYVIAILTPTTYIHIFYFSYVWKFLSEHSNNYIKMLPVLEPFTCLHPSHLGSRRAWRSTKEDCMVMPGSRTCHFPSFPIVEM